MAFNAQTMADAIKQSARQNYPKVIERFDKKRQKRREKEKQLEEKIQKKAAAALPVVMRKMLRAAKRRQTSCVILFGDTVENVNWQVCKELKKLGFHYYPVEKWMCRWVAVDLGPR